MKLEDMVCSLELSQRLKKIGIEQKSIFVWEYYDEHCHGVKFKPFAVVPDMFATIKLFSAFTSDELMEMLPAFIDTKENEPFNVFYLHVQKRTAENIRYIARYVCDSIDGAEVNNPMFQMPCAYKSHAPNLADCLAQLLINVTEKTK